MATWLAGRTLRTRLIAGLMALLALSCALVGMVTYLALRGGLYHQLDEQLAGANNRYVSCVLVKGQPPPQQPQPRPPGWYPPPLPHCGDQISGQAAGTFTALLDSYARPASQQVHNANITNGRCKLSRADRAVIAALPADGKPVTRELPSARGAYLLKATKQANGVVLVTGLPLNGLQSTLSMVEITEAAVFGAALLFAGLIGTAWVRLSLRPLSRITATATEVTNLPLASGEVDLPHRVELADPRTEVGMLGAAFNRMLGHVESALSRRHASEARLRTFAADASHELRTPLAAIRGYAQLARMHADELPDEVRRALDRVDAESARMSGLVEDLLLLARLDAGRPLERQPVDLTRLAIDATSDARVAAPGHRWQLDLPAEPVSVTGDEPRLRQVLANLLSNAAKHTPAGTTVTVALADSSASREAVLSVTDDGPGIPAPLQSRLFERFVRGTPTRSPSGNSTGLGLAIVDAVAAAHGGRVTVASTPGQTRFTVTLPALNAPAVSPRPAAARSVPAR
ncbi:MAG TPA: HAMP domain-containing sensor histidine kinase [Streptosporangiaceae bacterium]|jgi:two-component system OmpR family sensor kinase|nr:HAMP domain-containing sensor histidine kinase [Streptosporangiaceae bacterium]